MAMNIYSIELMIPLYSSHGDVDHSSRNLQRALDCLADINEDFLREYPHTPDLFQSGVVYEAEPERRVEQWQSIPALFRSKRGDCEDIACALVAFHRVRRNIMCRPYYSWRVFHNPYRVLYHIRCEHPCQHCGICHRWSRAMRRPLQCNRPDGLIEDPCIPLGMPSNAPEFASAGTDLTV